jgi:hypothetical protein
MRKIIAPILAVVFLGFALPAFAEWELGVSWTPVPNALIAGPLQIDSLHGFHAAYATSLFYASWDALSLPGSMVQDMTSYNDTATGITYPGYFAPGFLNLYDIGIRLALRPMVGFAEVGVNNLFVEDIGCAPGGFGANLRLGLGVKFDWWGITLTGTSVFATWRELAATVEALGASGTRPSAIDAIQASLVPSILFIWYLR